ncbi:hemerythrin domain-containing protein [Roseicyclus marinus]|uniref:hemerythrin domain-containing protein n=1 Tax=Roseicyclus marinus TaxID=2161673 RepID=UPI00240EABB5|nr:hemerythrin domain-containing protein [Roseicyclus marinus]MDG3039884.1 hemerythrin domain-containing protein [Roseicyclus marinus]
MTDRDIPAAPEETGALIDHILRTYHEMHRADLASLVPLATRVEEVHSEDPDVPKGLARALMLLAREMEDHMTKEERILFPVMRAGGGAGIAQPIAVMRADHNDYAQIIAQIRQLTQDLTPPEHACGSWRSLYRGTATLLDELADHIALENNVLFPRFEAA